MNDTSQQIPASIARTMKEHNLPDAEYIYSVRVIQSNGRYSFKDARLTKWCEIQPPTPKKQSADSPSDYVEQNVGCMDTNTLAIAVTPAQANESKNKPHLNTPHENKNPSNPI